MVILAERETTNKQTAHPDQRVRNLMLMVLTRWTETFYQQSAAVIQKLFPIGPKNCFLYMKNVFTQKTNKKIVIFPLQSVTNCDVLYCAWIIFINRNFKSRRRHSYVAISLCGDRFILPLLFSRRYPFVKQTKHILAVQSILLYDYIILTSHHILIGVYVLHNFSTNTRCIS